MWPRAAVLANPLHKGGVGLEKVERMGTRVCHGGFSGVVAYICRRQLNLRLVVLVIMSDRVLGWFLMSLG